MRFNVTIFAAILFLFITSCTSDNQSTKYTGSAAEPIKKVLAGQAESWNHGDLEGYMQGYWNSDSLKFIGKSGLTYGWKPTLQNYRKSYPDKEAMGKLTFSNLTIETLSAESAFVIGKWHLARTKGDLQGHFTLLFKKLNGNWKIVADHSS